MQTYDRPVRLIPGLKLPEPALLDLFNAGFSDYLLPMQLTAAAFAEHIAANDIDLGCSRVVLKDEPAAFALIARRDGQAAATALLRDDAPASLALERLGARRIATQHEMRLRL